MNVAVSLRSVRRLATFALGLLVVGCSGDNAPVGPGLDLPGPGDTVVPGQAMVRLLPEGSIESVNARHGTRTLEAIEEERVYLLGLPEGSSVEAVVAELRTDPEVSTAAPNGQVGIPEAQGRSTMAFADPSLDVADYTDQEAITRIHAPDAWADSRGAGVIVAVLDTGVDLTHPQLQGHIAPGGFDVIGGDTDPSDMPDGFDNDGDRLIDEALGHGTFVAGLILSVAPDAMILPIRVLNSDGVGSAVGIARGIQLAVERGAQVINLSLGMSVEADVVEEIIEDMVDDEGVVFVASA
jgi:subtilisin family serine protease